MAHVYSQIPSSVTLTLNTSLFHQSRNKTTLTHLAPLVLEQDRRVYLLHGMIKALQGGFHHGRHQDVRVQVVWSDGDGPEAEHHQPALSLQLHLWQRTTIHLHYLDVLRKFHPRTQHATVAVVQEGVQLR